MKEWEGEEIITTPEAASILAVSERRVRELCARGQLPAVKVARDWIIRRADIDAYRKLPEGRAGRPRRIPEQEA